MSDDNDPEPPTVDELAEARRAGASAEYLAVAASGESWTVARKVKHGRPGVHGDWGTALFEGDLAHAVRRADYRNFRALYRALGRDVLVAALIADGIAPDSAAARVDKTAHSAGIEDAEGPADA